MFTYKVIAISVKSSMIKYAVTVNFEILDEKLNKHLIHDPQLQQQREFIRSKFNAINMAFLSMSR